MKIIIDIPEKVATAIQNGEDYRYDIHTAIAQGIPYEPKGDLISREALKKYIGTYDGTTAQVEAVEVKYIDNAPTIKLEPFFKVTFDEDKLREIVNELKQEIIDGEIVLTEKKKTGHWNYASFGNQTLVKCSECEEEFLGNDVSDYRFCPICGCRMEEENE